MIKIDGQGKDKILNEIVKKKKAKWGIYSLSMIIIRLS